MTKLQPNFSFQKYQSDSEDDKKQFVYQLMQQHILVANAINATIDDASYWTTERATGDTWIDGAQIYTKTLTGVIIGSTQTAYPIGATIYSLASLIGTAQDAVPMAIQGLTLPYINTNGNDIGLYTDTTNIYVNAFDNTWAGYIFFVTIKYTKTRGANA